MKKYTSNTCLSVSIVNARGGRQRISFSPLTGGGSVFYTDNPDIIAGLEQHRHYGKMFHAEDVVEESPTPMVEPDASETVDTPSDGTIVVKNLTEAKDYLCERFGLSRTKLKGEDGVRKAAEKCGVKFDFRP